VLLARREGVAPAQRALGAVTGPAHADDLAPVMTCSSASIWRFRTFAEKLCIPSAGAPWTSARTEPALRQRRRVLRRGSRRAVGRGRARPWPGGRRPDRDQPRGVGSEGLDTSTLAFMVSDVIAPAARW